MKQKIQILFSIALFATLTWSCTQSMASNEGQQKDEVQKHDKDGEGHGKESENHDRDAVRHAKETSEEHNGEHEKRESSEKARGEHDRDKGGDGEGEEDGTELAISETYNKVRNGARLILRYDRKLQAFIGTIENTTNEELKRVRVEVHLSNGKELGPTRPLTLSPGAKKNVKLEVTSSFKSWSTHAEVGNNEHGGDREGHDGEKDGEEHN